MNNVTLAIEIVSSIEVSKIGNSDCAKTQVRFISGIGDKQVTHTITAAVWGKRAEEFAKLEFKAVLVVSGSLEIYDPGKGGGERVYTINIREYAMVDSTLFKLNRMALVGRVGREIDMKYFESGAAVAKTSLAIRRTREQTDWFNIEAWSKVGETMGNYVRKGEQLAVSGEFIVETWQGQDGSTNHRPVLKVSDLTLIGGGNGNGGGGNGGVGTDYNDDF